MKSEKVTLSVDSAMLNTVIIFQQNWMIGYSNKGQQRNYIMRAVLVQ
jgi:hypothetical protein